MTCLKLHECELWFSCLCYARTWKRPFLCFFLQFICQENPFLARCGSFGVSFHNPKIFAWHIERLFLIFCKTEFNICIYILGFSQNWHCCTLLITGQESLLFSLRAFSDWFKEKKAKLLLLLLLLNIIRKLVRSWNRKTLEDVSSFFFFLMLFPTWWNSIFSNFQNLKTDPKLCNYFRSA